MVSEVDFRFVEVLEPSLCDNVVTSYDGLVNDAGCYEGVGIAVLDNGAMYEGNFLNGLMHGTGKITWPDGTVYQGMIADGLVRFFHSRQLFSYTVKLLFLAPQLTSVLLLHRLPAKVSTNGPRAVRMRVF